MKKVNQQFSPCTATCEHRLNAEATQTHRAHQCMKLRTSQLSCSMNMPNTDSQATCRVRVRGMEVHEQNHKARIVNTDIDKTYRRDDKTKPRDSLLAAPIQEHLHNLNDAAHQTVYCEYLHITRMRNEQHKQHTTSAKDTWSSRSNFCNQQHISNNTTLRTDSSTVGSAPDLAITLVFTG